MVSCEYSLISLDHVLVNIQMAIYNIYSTYPRSDALCIMHALRSQAVISGEFLGKLQFNHFLKSTYFHTPFQALELIAADVCGGDWGVRPLHFPIIRKCVSERALCPLRVNYKEMC